MPLPIPIEDQPSPGQAFVQPYYVRDKQNWAVHQERMRHNQALFTIGEYTMFCLMWHLEDHLMGLVDRCPQCYGQINTTDARKAKVAATYDQPEKHKCPYCFGTTFEGGYKALIVRPTIFSDTDEGEQKQARGVVMPQEVNVESTPDFRIRNGDYVFRINGDRWQLRVPERVTLRTGFGFPGQAETGIGYNHARAALEDPTSVAYLIPPSNAALNAILGQGRFFPYDFSRYEVIRAPLIPDDRVPVTTPAPVTDQTGITSDAYNIIVEQGSLWSRTFVWLNPDGTPAVNLNDYTARMQVRLSDADTGTPLLEVTSEAGEIVFVPNEGEIVVTIPASKTADLTQGGVYDIYLFHRTDPNLNVRLVDGTFVIDQAVTM